MKEVMLKTTHTKRLSELDTRSRILSVNVSNCLTAGHSSSVLSVVD